MMLRRSFTGLLVGAAVAVSGLALAGQAGAFMAKFDPALGPCDPGSEPGMTCDMRLQLATVTSAPTANVVAYVGTISAQDTSASEQTFFAASVVSEGTTPPTYTQKVSIYGRVKNPCGNWTTVDLDGIAGTVLPARSNYIIANLALPNAMTFTAQRTVSSRCVDGTSRSYTFKLEGQVEAPYLTVPPGGINFSPPPGSTRVNLYTRGNRLSNAKVTYGTVTTTFSASEDDYSKIEDFVEAYY